MPERIKAFRDPAVRARLDEQAHSPEAGVLSNLARWERLEVIEGFTPHSDAMTVHERIRFKEPGLLENRITVTDPKALTKPWETVKTYRKATRESGTDELREFACAEGISEAK